MMCARLQPLVLRVVGQTRFDGIGHQPESAPDPFHCVFHGFGSDGLDPFDKRIVYHAIPQRDAECDGNPFKARIHDIQDIVFKPRVNH